MGRPIRLIIDIVIRYFEIRILLFLRQKNVTMDANCTRKI